ncbi:MAG TPA: DUF4215 domain-containing protein, partial [Planctomycetes bacterium]|nr:DUF4215 domain-containing protein [Planctomycetota bacterium]
MARCGDALVQREVETCDDGNSDDSDACLADCSIARCGDSHIQSGVEACDDGNNLAGDGCAANCGLEG